MNRIDRLTAILIQLQTKRVVKAEEIASRFEISLRTVYRDVKALMEAGVPIGSEAGKGYFIVDGYHLPPVMFTQHEASALVLAGKLVEKMTDDSIRKEFQSALFKIQSVLHDPEKDHLESLQSHIEVRQTHHDSNEASEGQYHYLNDVQQAVVDKHVLTMDYFSSYNSELTKREVEPIGLFYYSDSWHLIAWCRLRNGYRDFRVDRIRNLKSRGEKFDARNLITLKEYLATIVQSNREMHNVVVLFDRSAARFLGKTKYTYGFVSEEDIGEKIRVTFLTAYVKGIARWLLMFGSEVEVESPDMVKERIVELVDELREHYKRVEVL
jgi:predicted DNA-binding transcriptional regulator YafY